MSETLTQRRRPVTVLGIGNDGCRSLTSRAMEAVTTAQWLVGGERQLAFFPQFHGERLVIKESLVSSIDRIAELAADNNVCVLASGDPLFYGIGALIVGKLGAEFVEVLPHTSSVQWAFARVGMKWNDAQLLSLHGRNRAGFLTRLKRSSKVAVLTDAENNPAQIAAWLLDAGDSGWQAWVCENLCGVDERVRRFTLEELAATRDIGTLNVLLLQRTEVGWKQPPVIPHLHEEAFAKRMPKKGLITKREVRTLSLAAMEIRPNSIIWDVGAGSGSVSIEAAMLAADGHVYAVEVDPEGCAICRENVATHGVDNVTVVEGRAPEALLGLPAPDAVFVGGSKGSMEEIIAVALERLSVGGRLVVNAITLENSAEAYSSFRSRGLTPEITLLQASRAEPLAHYMRYEAMNPIQIFAVTKPQEIEVAP
jgi:precorrin-6Y C5,15-methyltransferase (decarboxylating)